MQKENWENKITAYALKNAIEHEGKCVPGSVLNPLFNDGLKKEEIKEIMPLINEIVKKVNSMNLDEQGLMFKEFEENFKKLEEEKKKNERHGLPEIEDAKNGKVITRLAPEPSKYNHIGHAVSFLINYLYAKKYHGKCLMRFEDTNPEKCSQEYVDSMKEDLFNYLRIKPSGKIKFVSDDMKKLYSYAEKLIKMDKAYMCFCKREKLKELREKGIECSCRQHETKKNMQEWQEFLTGKYMKGQASLRLKGNMQSTNYVMRDPVIFRAVKENHYKYKNKYKVWPMYDFYNPIEDSLMKVTHIFRSNEFEVRVELQDYIKDLLKLKKQKIIQYGRFNILEADSAQGREIREKVKSGEYLGWDDPRLVTLKALKRRGIVKESFYELAESFGLSKYSVKLTFDILASINRKIIDPSSERYYFIQSPMKLEIKNTPKIDKIEVKIHPEQEKKRIIKINDIYISREDYEKNINNEVRLMHLFNIKLSKNNKSEFTSEENKDIPKIQWVSRFVKTKIMMPDASYIEGMADEGVKKLKIGSIIQFERFGFVKLDNINEAGEYEFWFAHR